MPAKYIRKGSSNLKSTDDDFGKNKTNEERERNFVAEVKHWSQWRKWADESARRQEWPLPRDNFLTSEEISEVLGMADTDSDLKELWREDMESLRALQQLDSVRQQVSEVGGV